MYAVSDEYKAAMKSPVQRFRMTGKLAGVPFTDNNILKGSFSITNQCCDNNEMKVGQVYVGELSGTFVGLKLERYSLMEQVVEPIFGRMLAAGHYEDVPLGVYNISEVTVTATGLVIKAYDNMAKLDKNCRLTTSMGLPYELALMACEECGVELGTTAAEFELFANGNEILSMYAPNDIETWRDFLSWLAQACACNVTCDRQGKIIFRPYDQNVIDEIDPRHRFKSGSFADYETRYTGLSVVNMQDGTTKYYGMETDDALTYNMGSNPFLQYGLGETKERQRRAVLTALQSVRYVPYKVRMMGDPAYDLGDVFRFTDGIADGEKIYCLTKYVFKFNGDYEMQGVGKNPALSSAKSKTDKNISGLISQIESKKVPVLSYTNAGNISVEDKKETQIITIGAAAATDSQSAFIATVPLTMSLDGIAKFRFYIDAVLQDEDTVSVYLPRGAGMVPLTKPLEMAADSRLTLSVTAQTEYFESDDRQQDAKIGGLIDHISAGGAYAERKIDITPPSAVIADKSIKAVLLGQGLAVGVWDGTITLSDSIGQLNMVTGDTAVSGLADIFGTDIKAPIGGSITETVGIIKMTGIIAVSETTDIVATEKEEIK